MYRVVKKGAYVVTSVTTTENVKVPMIISKEMAINKLCSESLVCIDNYDGIKIDCIDCLKKNGFIEEVIGSVK